MLETYLCCSKLSLASEAYVSKVGSANGDTVVLTNSHKIVFVSSRVRSPGRTDRRGRRDSIKRSAAGTLMESPKGFEEGERVGSKRLLSSGRLMAAVRYGVLGAAGM